MFRVSHKSSSKPKPIPPKVQENYYTSYNIKSLLTQFTYTAEKLNEGVCLRTVSGLTGYVVFEFLISTQNIIQSICVLGSQDGDFFSYQPLPSLDSEHKFKFQITFSGNGTPTIILPDIGDLNNEEFIQINCWRFKPN